MDFIDVFHVRMPDDQYERHDCPTVNARKVPDEAAPRAACLARVHRPRFLEVRGGDRVLNVPELMQRHRFSPGESDWICAP